MKINLLIFLYFVFLINSLFSQAPDIQWQKVYGGSASEGIYGIVETADGGYLLGGSSESDSSEFKSEHSRGELDYWIIKIDSLGNKLWDKTIGGSDDDYFTSLVATSDSGFLLCGFSKSQASGEKSENNLSLSVYDSDYWIVKTDSMGNIEWENTIGAGNKDESPKGLETNDHEFIIAGASDSDVSGDKSDASGGGWDTWIVKLNSSGTIISDTTMPSLSYSQTVNIALANDYGFVTIGTDASNFPITKIDYAISKLNNDFTVEWQRLIGCDGTDEPIDVIVLNDGSIIVTGWSYSNSCEFKSEDQIGLSDQWIVKLNAGGDILWENTVGGNYYDNWAYIDTCSDGNLILATPSLSDVSGDKSQPCRGLNDFWFIKMSSSTGEILWEKTVGGNNYDLVFDVIETKDHGFLAGGNSISGISGDKTEPNLGVGDYWVVKLYPDCDPLIRFEDFDGDGFGDINDTIFLTTCDTILATYVANSDDCNDENEFIFPGQSEICNLLDDNCNNIVDEDLPLFIYFIDSDEDGFGNILIDSSTCFPELPGFVIDSTDCDDTNAEVNPGSVEVFNGLDDNCNSLIDENVEIEDFENRNFIIYPNPSSDRIIITLNNSNHAINNSTFTISDLSGKIIAQNQLTTSSTEVDISNFAAGVYFIKVIIDGEEFTEKLIKA